MVAAAVIRERIDFRIFDIMTTSFIVVKFNYSAFSETFRLEIFLLASLLRMAGFQAKRKAEEHNRASAFPDRYWLSS